MKEEKIIGNVNNVTRTLIWRYIQTKGITLNKFCLEAITPVKYSYVFEGQNNKHGHD